MFISDLKVCFEDILSRLQSDRPAFISRIGGSDTAAVLDYLRVKNCASEELKAHAARYMPLVSRYNGFYDRSNSLRTYQDYCEELLRTYECSETLFFCNFQLLSLYFKDSLDAAFYQEDFENKELYKSFIDTLSRKIPSLKCYPYQFIERMILGEHTLFRAFSRALAGKTVLVVSPFAESINANFHRRHSFFKGNYIYPEFQLRVVNTPITYADLPSGLYPDASWFSTVHSLQAEIAQHQFDIALLSCGSYAMPLGVYISQSLRAKAVYVGGVLQLYFGIMGRRYQNPFFLDQMNQEAFIYPLERDRYLQHVTITDGTAREAFGAYF